MGLYILIIILIYVFIFKSALKKKNRSGKIPSAPKTPNAAPDYSGSVSRPQSYGNAAGRSGSVLSNPFRRSHSGPEACEDDHAYCSHISVDGKFRDFENRENDWLARQMAEERRIASRLDFLR